MGNGTPFQHVNDSIRRLAPAGQNEETWEFFCECQDIGCHATVSLTLLEFDTRRAASPPVPVVVGHENGEVTVGKAASGT